MIAEDLFTRNGLFDTQMRDVAAAADVSRTTLYRYFQDKLDLAMAILERVIEDLDCRVRAMYSDAGGNGLERLERYLRARWFTRKFDRHRRFLAEFDTFFSGPRISMGFRGRLGRALRGHPLVDLQQIISDGIQDGSIRPDIDPALATVTVFNAVRSLSQLIVMRGKVLVEVRRNQLGKMPEELLRYLLDGLRPK